MKKLVCNIALAIGLSYAVPVTAGELTALVGFAATTLEQIRMLIVFNKIQPAIEARLLMAPEEHRDTLRPIITAEILKEFMNIDDALGKSPVIDTKKIAPTMPPYQVEKEQQRRSTPSKYSRNSQQHPADKRCQHGRAKKQ